MKLPQLYTHIKIDIQLPKSARQVCGDAMNREKMLLSLIYVTNIIYKKHNSYYTSVVLSCGVSQSEMKKVLDNTSETFPSL